MRHSSTLQLRRCRLLALILLRCSRLLLRLFLLLSGGGCGGDLLGDGKSGDGGDLIDLGGVGQVHEAGADRLLDALLRSALAIVAVEQPRKNTDRDALEQDDLKHLAVDRGCLQVEQLA